jgi:hypothetical protein
MRLEICFNDMDSLKYKEFLRMQAEFHHEAECEHPGTKLEITYHPAIGYLVEVSVGSAVCNFENVTVDYLDI